MKNMSKEIARWCGYTDMFAMLRDNLNADELMDLLESYVHEDVEGWAHDLVSEIAKESYEYIDHEALQADADDRKYQEYKDRKAGDE